LPVTRSRIETDNQNSTGSESTLTGQFFCPKNGEYLTFLHFANVDYWVAVGVFPSICSSTFDLEKGNDFSWLTAPLMPVFGYGTQAFSVFCDALRCAASKLRICGSAKRHTTSACQIGTAERERSMGGSGYPERRPCDGII